jgi:hypothetical protein
VLLVLNLHIKRYTGHNPIVASVLDSYWHRPLKANKLGVKNVATSGLHDDATLPSHFKGPNWWHCRQTELDCHRWGRF